MNKPKRSATSLQAALARSVAASAPAEPETPAQAPSAPAAPAPKLFPEYETLSLPVTFFVTEADRKRIHHLKTETGLSINKLTHMAWNLLLEERGLDGLNWAEANRPSGRQRRRT
ncbi:hypothetical protein [Methylobacterium sp. J-092]|uniref:hypothetical protein n=1 Tax=Methylobacterium sp. J-092 TaxID=2836667 RepID=UPI001FB88263|nr:hypothetical protein [Methylobacterium sp. J-092]MCJ2009177.1 hypothetical protein [Methylobacterium sp. J-092]